MKRAILILIASLVVLVSLTGLEITQGTPVGAKLRPGVFLFASPDLNDPNFFQTVVLLIQHESDGAMGLIINKPTEMTLADALPDSDGMNAGSLPIYFGGPVSRNRILALLRSEKPIEGSIKVFKQIYYTGNKRVLMKALEKSSAGEKVRVYAGYAGWAPGQLDHEVGRGDWVISPADPDTIFSKDSSKVWPEVYNIQEQIEIQAPQWPAPVAPKPWLTQIQAWASGPILRVSASDRFVRRP